MNACPRCGEADRVFVDRVSGCRHAFEPSREGPVLTFGYGTDGDTFQTVFNKILGLYVMVNFTHGTETGLLLLATDEHIKLLLGEPDTVTTDDEERVLTIEWDDVDDVIIL